MSFDSWSVHAVSRDSWDWNSFTQVGAVIASSGRLFHLTVVLEFCPPPYSLSCRTVSNKPGYDSQDLLHTGTVVSQSPLIARTFAFDMNCRKSWGIKRTFALIRSYSCCLYSFYYYIITLLVLLLASLFLFRLLSPIKQFVVVLVRGYWHLTISVWNIGVKAKCLLRVRVLCRDDFQLCICIVLYIYRIWHDKFYYLSPQNQHLYALCIHACSCTVHVWGSGYTVYMKPHSA